MDLNLDSTIVLLDDVVDVHSKFFAFVGSQELREQLPALERWVIADKVQLSLDAHLFCWGAWKDSDNAVSVIVWRISL